MKAKLKISIQPKPTSKEVTLLRLVISFNQSDLQTKQTKVKLPTGNFTNAPSWANDDLLVDASQTKKVYKQVRISSGISIPTTFWDNKKKICLGIHSSKNQQLKEIIDSIHLLYDSLSNVTIEQFQQKIKEKVIQPSKDKPTIEKKKIAVEEPKSNQFKSALGVNVPTLFTEYILFKCNVWSNASQPKAESTLDGYTGKFLTWIKRYEQYAKFQFDLLKLSNNEVMLFLKYLGEQRKEDGSPFTVKYVHYFRQTFKMFITEAQREDEMPVNVDVKKKMFAAKKEKTDDVYLTYSMLSKIKKAKYDRNDITIRSKRISEDMFEWCKDLALVTSACGLRWSDMEKLDEEVFRNQEGEYYFDMQKAKKTDNKGVIPCFDQDVVQVFKKYGNKFPLYMTEQSFNETIKIVCRLAGLTQVKTQYRRHPETLEQIRIKKAYYEIVSHKTFRKTFASNLIREYNVPLVIAMSYTMHKSESAFKEYIRLEPAEYYQIGLSAMKENSKLKIVS